MSRFLRNKYAVKNCKYILKMRRSQFNTLCRDNLLLFYFDTVVITSLTIVLFISTSYILISTHSHLFIIVIITINLGIFFFSSPDSCGKFIFVGCSYYFWGHL